MQKPLVTIESWSVVQRAVALNYGELQPGKHLVGKVVGHAKLSGEEYVYTSPIVRVGVDEGLVETRNTVYRLGEPSDGYKSWTRERAVSAAA